MNKLTLIAVAALPLFFLAGCGGGHEPKRAEAAALPAVPVQTVAVETADWPVTVEAPGTVRARTSAVISARMMGYLREIRVRPGDRVSAGQLLVTIDSRDLDSSVAQAEAAETEARSAVAEADNGIAGAKAQLALAQATFRRMETLHKQTSISDQEFDEAQARLRTAEAAVAMAVSKRSQLDAKISQAKQAVASAGVMHGYAQIRAPFAGVVTEKPAEAGQLATPGAPLLTIEQGGAYRLEASVEESLLGSLRLGQAVKVALDASGQTLDAKVDEIVPAVDAQSRAFLVKASIPSRPEVRSGMFGRLILDRGSRQSSIVPVEAISQRGELQSVLVAENGTARLRMITTGSRRDGKAEVLSGLAAGDRVIRPGSAVADGRRVEVR